MTTHSVLWRRLDSPGHDACRFSSDETGFLVEGTAVFRHNGAAARLSYDVQCDAEWRTRCGSVRGFVGPETVDVAIERTVDGTWTRNREIVPGFERFVHLDFGFTPATNLPQLRQLALAEGQSAELPVVWLDVPPAGLRVLRQRYERRKELTYWYEAPDAGYSGLLEITPEGFVRRYPGLWELEE